MSIQEIALAFCRECLGWGGFRIQDSVVQRIENGKLVYEHFFYDSPTCVLDAVRNWCMQQRLWWRLACSDHSVIGAVSCAIGAQMGSGELLGEAMSKNICQAIMSACLEAAPKMKEQAA